MPLAAGERWEGLCRAAPARSDITGPSPQVALAAPPPCGHQGARPHPAGRPAGMGRDGHPAGCSSPPRAGTRANRGDRTLDGAVRPHPRGRRHVRARGSVGSAGGRRDPTPSGKRHRQRKRRHPLGQHRAAFPRATRGGVGRETRSVRLSRLGRAMLSRH